MTRKIMVRLAAIGGFSVLLTAVLTTLVYYNLFQKQIQEDLRTAGQILAHAFSQGQALDYLELRLQTLRMTIIAPDGTVFYESDVETELMDNHLDRPEVLQALKRGEGQSIRQSATLGKNTFYFALLLPDGKVLRVARDAHNIWMIFAKAFPTVAGLGLLIFLLCLSIARLLTRRIVQPITKLAENLDQLENGLIYDELVPFARKIKEQQGLIQRQLEQLEQENTKIQLIIEHMAEGLILLDRDKTILRFNPSAIELFGVKPQDYIGKNLLYFSRHEGLHQAVRQAFSGRSQTLEIELEDRVIQVFVNPVVEKAQIIGAICFIFDVSAAKQSERIRREFTANVSHELKTPLTSISGYAELLENDLANPQDIKQFAAKIKQEAVRLLELINHIIRLSELDEPSTVEFEPVDLYAVARTCVESLALQAQRREVEISLKGEACQVQANPQMMEELVYNLCDNAIRYNRPGGIVKVEVKPGEDEVQFLVEDTGIGIPPQHQERIFERFYRVDKSRFKETGGTGLGLAIVKHIVKWHEGMIQLTSTEGVGTRIAVTLPRKRSETPS